MGQHIKSFKWIMRILFSVSLLFILFYIIDLEKVEFTGIQSWQFLVLSVILLFPGFFADALGWREITGGGSRKITYRDSVISCGKYVYTKYIPGKIWVVLGRAGYIKEKYGGSLVMYSSYALIYQVISISAALVSGIGLFWTVRPLLLKVSLVFIAVFIILMFVFRKFSFRLLSLAASKLLGRKLEIEALSVGRIIRSFVITFFLWLMWAFSFFLFILSMKPEGLTVPVNAGLVFPFASVAGIMVIFAPGGLGVRESFITLGLTGCGIPLQEAALLSLYSRLWFLCGETLFFIFAVAISLKKNITVRN